MKIRLLSDLHLEFKEYRVTYGGEDLLVLAGDISPDKQDVMKLITDYLNQDPKAIVIFVPGNHDYYYSTIEETDEFYANISLPRFHFLQNNSIVINGIRFYGTTMWSDLSSSDTNLIESMRADYRLINSFTTKDMGKIFLKSCEGVRRITEESEEPIVVITHHLPSYQSISPHYKNKPTNPSFASHLDYLVIKTKIWMHGHTHSTQDYKIKDTRVVCNPRGYIRSSGPENLEFLDTFIVEI